ncbi:hypothetical protein ACH5RR_023604 [Cinchona calisaya]|uniref:Uncharacterized protein n=1 Tax=Cinchona calisaya TaxID=153742 RepID=A0ABD2ZB39_9GENT
MICMSMIGLAMFDFKWNCESPRLCWSDQYDPIPIARDPEELVIPREIIPDKIVKYLSYLVEDDRFDMNLGSQLEDTKDGLHDMYEDDENPHLPMPPHSLASPHASMPFSSDHFNRQDTIPLESSSSIPFCSLDGMNWSSRFVIAWFSVPQHHSYSRIV